MNIHVDALVEKYGRRGLLLDTNLYVLWLVGLLDPSKIGRHRRVKAFAVDDFRTLDELISRFSALYTTPNVMSEISNLVGVAGSELVSGISVLLSQHILVTREEYLSTHEAVKEPCFPKLGVTDTALSMISRRGPLLMTDDWRLALYVESMRVDVINFNHLRRVQ